MSRLLRRGTYSSIAALMAGGVTSTFANLLLTSETQGFAIDATDVSATPAYVGAPYAGWVSVIDTGTPANDLSNVPLDNSNLTQSGTSPKMVLWNSSPYVRWAPHNLIQQSQTFGTTWTGGAGSLSVTSNNATAPDGTSTADTITFSASGSVYQTTTSLASVLYTASFYLKYTTNQWAVVQLRSSAGADRVRAWFDIQNGTLGSNAVAGTGVYYNSTITSVGSGWYRCTITGTCAATDIGPNAFGVAANSDFNPNNTGFIAWGGQFNRGYEATPYLVTTTAARYGIPQEYDTAASKYCLLCEPAATNLRKYSEDLSGTGWTDAGTTRAYNQTTAPDGTSTADQIKEDGAAGLHVVYESGAYGTINIGDIITISGFFKANERSYALMRMGGASVPSPCSAKFNLSNGTATILDNANSVSASAISVGNGWYRCSMTLTAPATGINYAPNWGPHDGGSAADYSSTTGNSVYFWGAQFEIGPVATSYIPTLAASVTRAKDQIGVLTSAFPYSSTAETNYLDWKLSFLDSSFPIPYEIYSGTNNRHGWYVDDIAVPYQYNRQGGAYDVTTAFSAISANTRLQFTGAYKSSDFDGSVDGGALGSSGSGTRAAGDTNLSLGGRFDYNNTLPLKIYRFVYVPRQVQTESGNLSTWRYNF